MANFLRTNLYTSSTPNASNAPVEPTENVILEIKEGVLRRVDQEGIDNFDARDIDRVRHDGQYLKRFYLEFDGKDIIERVITTLKWRQQFAVNDISRENINQDILKNGEVLCYNRDKDDCRILLITVRKHLKDRYNSMDLKRCIVYWLEYLEREEYCRKISIFFDLENTKLCNVNLELVRFLDFIFVNHYPWIVHTTLVYEMPCLLVATWTIVKNFIPTKSAEKIRFVNKKNITNYIDKDQCLVSWGGTDKYNYEIPEESVTELPWLKKARM